MAWIIVWRSEPWAGKQGRIETVVDSPEVVTGMARGFTENGASFMYVGSVMDFEERLSKDGGNNFEEGR